MAILPGLKFSLMSKLNMESPRSRINLRVLIDYIMGAVIGLLGLFFLLRGQFPDLAVNKHLGEPDRTDWMFGTLSIAYAIWRVLRGRRKSTQS